MFLCSGIKSNDFSKALFQFTNISTERKCLMSNGSECSALENLIIVIILPAYNEEPTIAETIKSFNRELPYAEVWVINNNSSDATEEVAINAINALGCAGGVINEHRQGKGNAIRSAFRKIEADIYILADADMTYPAEMVGKLMQPILDGRADMVVGDRHSCGDYKKENKRRFHGVGNKLVRLLVNKLFKASLVDIMSGYRVFNRNFIKLYPILVEGFEIETDMTLHALDKRFQIVEIPVQYKDRPKGSFSKLNTIADGLKVISTICNILRYYRPLYFFGCLSFALGLLGLIAAIPVIQDYLYFRYINHIPLAILATGLEVSAFIFFSIGLVLDSMAHQERLSFERHLLGFMSNERN
jgi:glycosyltransferase involved in cell wall biosynthesis